MQFLDRHLTVNATLFDTRYKDFQAQGIELLPDGTTNFRLANVGKLESKGVEIDSNYHVNEDLTFGGSVAYLTGDHRLPVRAVLSGTDCCTGLHGHGGEEPESKRRDAAGGAGVESDGQFRVHASAQCILARRVHRLVHVPEQDQRFAERGPRSRPRVAKTIANFAFGIRGADSRWEVMAFINNAFDKHYYQNIAHNPQGNYNNQLALQSYLPRDFEALCRNQGVLQVRIDVPGANGIRDPPQRGAPARAFFSGASASPKDHSTVTLFARLRG